MADSADFDPTLKKKSKKKKTADFQFEEEPQTEETQPQEGDANMFADLKKKKKSKEKSAEQDAEEEQTDEVEEVTDSMENMFLDQKKKKRKKKTAESSTESLEQAAAEDEESAAEVEAVDLKQLEASWQDTDKDYVYRELLSRVFCILKENNPELSGEKRKYKMIPPQVVREGKKTVFANIEDICKRMRRTPKHLEEFLFAELGTTGSVDGENRLIIKGRFQQKQMETVLLKYIEEYVTCKTCKSRDTNLAKENRLSFLVCEACGSKRTVTAIKQGFRAQTEKRKLTRQA